MNAIVGCMSGCAHLFINISFATNQWNIILSILHSFTHALAILKRWFPAGIFCFHHFIRKFVYRLCGVAVHEHNHFPWRAVVKVHSDVSMLLPYHQWRIFSVEYFHILNGLFTSSLFLCETFMLLTRHTAVNFLLLVHLFATHG